MPEITTPSIYTSSMNLAPSPNSGAYSFPTRYRYQFPKGNKPLGGLTYEKELQDKIEADKKKSITAMMRFNKMTGNNMFADNPSDPIQDIINQNDNIPLKEMQDEQEQSYLYKPEQYPSYNPTGNKSMVGDFNIENVMTYDDGKRMPVIPSKEYNPESLIPKTMERMPMENVSGSENIFGKSKDYLAGIGEKVGDFLKDDSYEGRLDKSSLLSGAIEVGGVISNIVALQHDKKAKIFDPIDKVGANYHNFKSVDITSPGTESINRSESRMIQAAREGGVPESITGIMANSAMGKSDLAFKQGASDSDSFNKTIAINADIDKYIKELNTRVEMFNSQGKTNEASMRSQMVNADRNAIFQGVKNMGSIYQSNIYNKYLADQMEKERQNQLLIANKPK